MADPKPLTRAQLARFLPDAEAIKAFESLFTVAGETTPAEILELSAAILELETSVLELSYLANTLKSRIQESIRNLEEAESIQPRPANLIGIEVRLNELEMQLTRRSNDDALLRRIENLEQLVGV